MKVILKFPYSFCLYHPEFKETISIEINKGESIEQILKRLGIIEKYFGLIVINERREPLSFIPGDGDTIELVPIIAGG